jgi:hypothetical protein
MKTILKISIFLLFGVTLYFNQYKVNAQVVIGVTVREAPPELPVYVQPMCPEDGYLWTPGYWAYGDDGYYWVPGAWVRPPQYGYLWTPCYWGFSGGYYGYHAGYWGQHVGFYGGINYGYGYGGSGYGGGRWAGNSFQYNTAVMNVNRTVVRNTYVDKTVVNNTSVRTSFNGQGGTAARPTTQEEAAGRENHVASTSAQTSHEQLASKDRNHFASVNKGRPATTVTNKVGEQQVTKSVNPHQAGTHAARQSRQTRRATKQQVAHQQKSKGNSSKHG